LYSQKEVYCTAPFKEAIFPSAFSLYFSDLATWPAWIQWMTVSYNQEKHTVRQIIVNRIDGLETH
jgi:hypothetical protein